MSKEEKERGRRQNIRDSGLPSALADGFMKREEVREVSRGI